VEQDFIATRGKQGWWGQLARSKYRAMGSEARRRRHDGGQGESVDWGRTRRATTRGAKRGHGRVDSTMRTAPRLGRLPRRTRRRHATTPPRPGTEARTGSQVEDAVGRDLGRELGENRGASREPATARKGTQLRTACGQGTGHGAGQVPACRGGARAS
jgi:hypothetical protein